MGAVGPAGILILTILCISPAARGSSCPPLAVGPSVLQAAAGRCALFPCRFRLCPAAPADRWVALRWLRDPAYSRAHGDYRGGLLASSDPAAVTRGRLLAPPGGAEGDCSLALPAVTEEDGGYYGMRLRANSTRRGPEWKWLHGVRLNVSAAPPPPHLSPAPAPLPEGLPVTLTCWTPPGCPDEDPPALTWEGPAAEREGAETVPATPPPPPSEGDDDDPLLLPPPPPGAQPWGGVALALKFVPTWDLDGTALRCGRRDPRPGGGWGGEVWSERRLRVLYAPRDVRVELTPPSPVMEGRGVTLRCRAAANPPPHSFGWSRDGAALQRDGAELSLAARAAEAGLYGCTATSSLGAARARAVRLEVHYPPRSAAVTPLTPLPAVEGSRVTLRCSVGPAHPAPTVQWERLDEPWQAAIGPELSFEAVPSREGTYRCVASNAAGNAPAAPVRVVVWYAPRAASITQSPPGPLRAAVGGAVTLLCRWGAARPPPTEVTWFRGGVRLHSSPSSVPYLRLGGPRPEQRGHYECEVRNAAGRVRSAPYWLEVLYPPLSVTLRALPGPALTEGAALTLRCEADGNPRPHRFDLERDGAPLGGSADGRWAMAAVGTAARGRYRCTATNRVGSASSGPLGVSVRLSRATIIRRTSGGAAAAVAALLLTGALVWHFRRRCCAHPDVDVVVEPMGTFFLRPKKPPLLTPPPADEEPGSSESPRPHSCSGAQRPYGDVMLYSALQESHGAKVPEGPDYENVPNADPYGAPPAAPYADPYGAPPAEPPEDPNGAVLYAALALPPPGAPWGRSGAGGGDGVEYEELRG